MIRSCVVARFLYHLLFAAFHHLRALIACRLRSLGSVPSEKILRWANVCFVAHEAHATAQPCRNATNEAFLTLKGLCDVYTYRIKFRMLVVRENEIALRKMSGVTAQLRILEGTLLLGFLYFLKKMLTVFMHPAVLEFFLCVIVRHPLLCHCWIGSARNTKGIGAGRGIFLNRIKPAVVVKLY